MKITLAVLFAWMFVYIEGQLLRFTSSDFVEGEEGSVTCMGDWFDNITIYRSFQTITSCDLPSSCNIDPGFNSTYPDWSDYYNISQTGNSVTISIQNISRQRDGELWRCRNLNETQSIYFDVKVPVTNITMVNKFNLLFTDRHSTYITCRTGYANPSPNITWSIIEDSRVLVTNVRRTSVAYVFSAKKFDNNKTLECSAFNGYGQPTNDSVRLVIRYKPVVHLSLTTSLYKIIQGTQLVLTCVVDAQPPVPSTGFRWNKNGGYISGKTSNILTITDAGSYTCRATNIVASTTTSPIAIYVLYPPVVTTPSVFKIIESTSLSIPCTATGNPSNINYSWTGPNGFNISSNVLTISNINTSQSGQYICSAFNTMIPTNDIQKTGEGRSTTIINVLYGPIITVSTESININESDTLTIKCTVQSNPAPTSISWYNPDGTEVTDPQSLIISTSYRKYLIISMIKRNQSGVYRCEGRNTQIPTNGSPEHRSINKTTTVVVQFRPDPPYKPRIQSHSNNQICVEWKSGYNGRATQTFIVQHSTDDNTWVDSSPISDRNDGQLIQYCIKDLDPETQYYIKIAAKNIVGESQVLYFVNTVKTTLDKGDGEEYSKVRASGIGIGIGICVGVVLLVLVSFFIYRKYRRGKPKSTNADENYSTLNPVATPVAPSNYQELDIRTYENLGTSINTENPYVNT